jgi:hypothetical protein
MLLLDFSSFFLALKTGHYMRTTTERYIMEKFLANLKAQAEENPFVALGIGVAVFTAASKFIDAAGSAYGRRTWSKEVARRSKHAKK